MFKELERTPIISIILPTYNGGKYIDKSIKSVIAQSFSDWELLVVDDGSTDNTADIIKKYEEDDKKIIYLKNEVNLGIQKSLNYGLKKARGKYVARIDDDDTWVDADKLRKQFDFLEDNREYVLVGTGVIVVDEDDNKIMQYILPTTDYKIRKNILMKNCFIHSSVMFRADSVESLGGYKEDNNSKNIEDYDLWLRLGTHGKFANLSSHGVCFMQRGGSISSENKIEQFKKNLDLIEKFKAQYPRYFRSMIFGYLRLFFYRIFVLMPDKLKRIILKIYKTG